MENVSVDRSVEIKREVTLGAGAANVYGLIFIIPALIFIVIPYYFLWPEQFTLDAIRGYFQARDALSGTEILLGFLVLFAGIVLHELLHGIGWSFYTKNGWKSIRFGVMWKFLTPYCHCSEPLLLKPYRIGAVLPAIVLGILPSLAALITGNLWLLVFGFFFTFSAGGDFLMLWLLRKEKPNALVQDHPDKIGCIVFERL